MDAWLWELEWMPMCVMPWRSFSTWWPSFCCAPRFHLVACCCDHRRRGDLDKVPREHLRLGVEFHTVDVLGCPTWWVFTLV